MMSKNMPFLPVFQVLVFFLHQMVLSESALALVLKLSLASTTIPPHKKFLFSTSFKERTRNNIPNPVKTIRPALTHLTNLSILSFVHTIFLPPVLDLAFLNHTNNIIWQINVRSTTQFDFSFFSINCCFNYSYCFTSYLFFLICYSRNL